MLFVCAKNSSLPMLFSFIGYRPKVFLQNIKIYSWTSLKTGLLADRQLPQAQEVPAAGPLVPYNFPPHKKTTFFRYLYQVCMKRNIRRPADIGDIHTCPATFNQHACRFHA